MALGMRSMAANFAALQTIGNNIANANTAGYSRQSVDLETAGGQFSGSGFFGKGVNVATVTRAYDQFLTREAYTTRSVAASDQARSLQLQSLEKIFVPGEAGLGFAAGQLFNSFVDVANKPQDASARQVVLSRAGELAARFRTAGAQLDDLQAGAALELKTSVAGVNMLARQIAELNVRIAAVKGAGHEPNDLLDQRDSAINDLSQYLQVTTVAASDGSMSVFIGGGQKLVLGVSATELSAIRDQYDPQKFSIAIREPSGDRAIPNELLTGGSMEGLLRFQNSDLVEARNLLGQMAAGISGRVNQQQALGLTLAQTRTRGEPIFSVGSPAGAPKFGAIAAAGNTGGAAVSMTLLGATELEAMKVSGLQPSDYELRANINGVAGDFELVRLRDGMAMAGTDPTALPPGPRAGGVVRAGDWVDGFQINVTGTPGAGDTFLLQPAGSAARDMRVQLADPKGIAAASQVAATFGAGNAGTATVGTLRAANATLNPNLAATITFTNANGGYDYTLVDETGTLPTVTGSGVWAPGQVPNDRIGLNGWELELRGVPAAGDSVVISKSMYWASDNGNANALMSLRDARIVGQVWESDLNGSRKVPGDTITDAFANALANVGVRVQSAASAAQQSGAIAADAARVQAGKAGVNLDEEAARLIQFQQSYQASAKMLQVAQSLFDSLLQITSG